MLLLCLFFKPAGAFSYTVIAVRGCSRVSVTVVCVRVCVWFVCFEVFGVTSLIKEHWKPKCLSLSVLPPLSVLSSSLSVPDAPPHSLSQSRVLDWCEMCFFEPTYRLCVRMCVCICLLCGHFPLRLHSPEQLSSPGHKADACYPHVPWQTNSGDYPGSPSVQIYTLSHSHTHTHTHTHTGIPSWFRQGCFFLHSW